MGNLYKCAGPTVGLLPHFFLKMTNAQQMPGGGGGGACSWNCLSHNKYKDYRNILIFQDQSLI